MTVNPYNGWWESTTKRIYPTTTCERPAARELFVSIARSGGQTHVEEWPSKF